MNTGDARTEIIHSIRTHLATSVSATSRASAPVQETPVRNYPAASDTSVVELFKQNLEAVDGHCIIVHSETEVEETVKRIAAGKLIAKSDEPPATEDLFKYDVGITSAQAGIAETGTLVLDSSVERNRLVSLVPRVHIAILDAARIFLTLGETLSMLQSGKEVSPAITFITGPSRTADIELTLTIGVHGPQELYVVVIQNNR